MCVLRFRVLCCTSFRERKETFYGRSSAHLGVTRQVVLWKCYSERSCNLSRVDMESMWHLGSRYPNRYVLVLGENARRFVITRFEQRLECVFRSSCGITKPNR